ncbi:von Willebrand factor type A domain-containing protein [Rhodopirellula maiorica SM1]|uniref:von Willebrand factor type A domain-containing protein n=1 Tax=Rhodopirellula maiorica SM1 TaxID=1265738 RepID=M5RF74_9BACT|nr:VIT domain-containing protein [Rhodopirellula maiorica]EMI18123.1 von Willebrand factor type A domain-containing protein [Rhodopirellula maiorica SM1]
MIAQPPLPRSQTMFWPLLKSFSALATIFLFSAVAQAGYTVLSGTPVTQGQMRVDEDDFDQLKARLPAPSQCFTLKETRVEADISGVLARVRVSQVFKNPYSERLEALYVFPLPENCAVDAYSFQIGERVIVGEVKRKEEARQEYEQARDQGRKAALLEQERANIFSQAVANIPADSEVTVNIEYVHPLEIDEDRYVFRFPMVVGPRYIPGTPLSRPNVGRGWAKDTDQVPDASRITPDFLPEGMRNGNDVFVSVKVDAAMPIQEIVPVTHELDIQQPSETHAVVTLKNQSTIADKDFVIEYRLAGDESTLASLVHRESDADDGYVMLALQPKWSIEPAEITPREVILVLDTSGSMNGPAISQLRLFADHVLDHLNPQDEFRIIAFNNRSNAFRPHPIVANDANVQSAKQFVRNLRASGGTNLLPALQLALGGSADESARPRYMVLMTDALVGNDHSILRYLQKPEFQDARVFPIAFGAAPNDYLISRAAEMGRGFSMQVTNQDNSPEIARRFHELTSQPYMTDLQIDWGGIVVKDLVPSRLPDLYAGKPLIVLGRYDTPASGTITLKGNVLGQAVQMGLALELPQQESAHDSIGPVWARQRIRQIWNRDVGHETPQGREEITELGLKHQLMTQYTSFIAVEKELSEPPQGQLVTETVPVMMPEGMTEQSVGRSRVTTRPAQSNQQSTSPVVADTASPPQTYTTPPPAMPATSGPSRPSSASPAPHASGGTFRSGGGGGGGPIGPITAIFSLGGAGAAAMMRRRKAQTDIDHCVEDQSRKDLSR